VQNGTMLSYFYRAQEYNIKLSQTESLYHTVVVYYHMKQSISM